MLELEAAGQSHSPSGTEKGECVLEVPSRPPLTQFMAPSRNGPVPWVRIPTQLIQENTPRPNQRLASS